MSNPVIYVKLPQQLRMHLELKDADKYIYHCADGGILCHECVIENIDLICDNIEDHNACVMKKERTPSDIAQWAIVAIEEASVYKERKECDNCYKQVTGFTE